MDVDLPQVTIALDSIKILETDKNSKGTVVKYHPISKIVPLRNYGTGVCGSDLKYVARANLLFEVMMH